EVAEGIPFIQLTGWDESELYKLKGDLVRRGARAVTGIAMPVHEKRRFQHGSTDVDTFRGLFPAEERSYRNAFAELYADASRCAGRRGGRGTGRRGHRCRTSASQLRLPLGAVRILRRG